MALFDIGKNNQLQNIKEFPFKLEKDIQNLTEQNINTIFGLELVKSEFSIGNFRIDSLAFDKESSSFVIIEYKRDKNFSVIDQGYAYLSLMLNNKADFILEYNENCQNILKRNDVEWSQSRVLFISPRFTTYQKEAINFKDLPIELWEIKRYSNKTVSYNQVQTSGSQESIKAISNQNDNIDTVTKEIKVFTEQEHINNGDIENQELYHKLKEGILNIDDNITIHPKKQTVGFKIENNIFCDVVILNKLIKMYINLKSGDLKDERGIARDVSNVGHWGNGSYEIKMKETENIEYILSLIKQSINKNKHFY